MKKIISEAVIKRLPKYYKQLQHLQEQGIEKVSSSTIANLLGITASQVRQDFYNFGGFGQQGYGYDVESLKNSLARILGLEHEYNMIIIGAGNIGTALANYPGFIREGFKIKALFDIQPRVESIGNIPVYSMYDLKKYLDKNEVDIAVITTQKNAAASVANEVVSLGIKNIWNFAPIQLKVPDDVIVENISMSESLFVLSYRMNNKNN